MGVLFGRDIISVLGGSKSTRASPESGKATIQQRKAGRRSDRRERISIFTRVPHRASDLQTRSTEIANRCFDAEEASTSKRRRGRLLDCLTARSCEEYTDFSSQLITSGCLENRRVNMERKQEDLGNCSEF